MLGTRTVDEFGTRMLWVQRDGDPGTKSGPRRPLGSEAFDGVLSDGERDCRRNDELLSTQLGGNGESPTGKARRESG